MRRSSEVRHDMNQTRDNVPRDYLQHLRNLRAQGYADAEEQRPDRSGSLPGPAERLEYYKGWDDWHVRNVVGYKRWTPAEDISTPLGRRPSKT